MCARWPVRSAWDATVSFARARWTRSSQEAQPRAAMKDILRQTGAVDLVVADHGFAGAAIASGIPTVVVMDTNDPAFAVVAGRGADMTVVPMDDNRPLNAYRAALDVVRRGA